MIFQGCCFKNAGVAGYVAAFGIVQLENQASYIGYLFRNRCTSTVFHTKNPALQDSILVFNQDCELVSQLPNETLS